LFQTKKMFLFIALVIAIAVSCSDDPNSVGSALIPDKDILKSDSLNLYSDLFESFQKDSLYFGSSTTLLLGNYKNVSSKVLLTFPTTLPDSIKEPYSNNEASLKSAWFRIYPNYWIGDKSSVEFTAHQINTSWNPLLVNDDSLSIIESTKGDNILTSFTYEPGDTTIDFTIDQDLIENWAKRSFDNTFPSNNGILLSPTLNASSIFGFQALTSFPNDQYITLFLEFEKDGEFIDTVLSNPNLDLHVPTGEKDDDPVNGIILQSSIASRGKLKINLDEIPQNIVVNHAMLELFMQSSDEGTNATDTIAVSFLTNFESNIVNDEFGRYPMVRENNKFTGNVKQFVERWMEGESNEGLEIKLSDESRSANLITIHGIDDQNLKPQLTLYYTRK